MNPAEGPAPDQIPSGPNPQNPFAGLGLQLGVGIDWRPGQIHWNFAKGEIAGKRAVILVIDTALGRIALPFEEPAALRFIDQFREVLTGLEVASAIPPGVPAPFNGRRP